jgi:hypothetical protein
VADTRNPNGPFGGPELIAGTQRDFTIANSSCGIPSSAAAFALNLTVVPDVGLGYLSIWPSGETQPLVSTLNSDGRTKANAAIVTAGSNGGVSVYASDATHLIIDVAGYFLPAGSLGALAFYPLTPCRVADTRGAASPLGGPYISGLTARDFPILASACNVPLTALAYSLNFTAVPRSPLGYLTTWPTGQPQPPVSTLNAFSNTVTANAAIVTAGANGNISAYASNDTDLVIDINGYFAQPLASGLSLYKLAPCRVSDTRTATPPAMLDGQQAAPVAGGNCNVPAAAKAYVLNATVIPATFLGFLALWPDGEPQPVVSTLNADSAVTSNMAILPTNNGAIDVFTSQPAHVVLDISSYFAP